MSDFTVITVHRDAQRSVLDHLREAGIPRHGFSAVENAGSPQLKARFPDLRRTTLGEVGEVDVAGELWERTSHAGERVSDFLFRHGIDRDGATRVERHLTNGDLAILVDHPQLDTEGLKLSLQRTPGAEVIEAEGPRAPLGNRRPEGTRAEVRHGDVTGFARGGSR